MIVYGAFIVSILISLVCYFLYPKKILWWEFIVSISITVIVIFGLKSLIAYASVEFTEYWGESIVCIVEEEPYNYWHSEMCSRSYACGSDDKGNTTYCTEYYDCSHQDDVGPQWWCKTDLNNTYSLTEQSHDKIKKIFATSSKITDSKENYSPNDYASGSRGTKFGGKRVGKVSYAYSTYWNKSDLTRKGVFTKHSYVNKIKASDLSLFNISIISEKEADSLKLHKYPDVENSLSYPTILGSNVPEQIQEKYRKLNAKFGVSNKLRLWVLVFDNKPSSIAIKQENYWVKGNKNELIICIGRNKQNIDWTYSFSWSLSNDLTAEVNQKALELQVLDNKSWNNYYDYLNANLHRFNKRSFKEFNYLTVELKTWQIILIYVITIALSIGINVWAIKNEFND
jgi:hypothetical protein